MIGALRLLFPELFADFTTMQMMVLYLLSLEIDVTLILLLKRNKGGS